MIMISLYIITSIILFNFVLILFLKNREKLFVIPNLFLMISIFSFFIGLILIFWQENEINKELSKRNWNVIKGEIVDSEIVGKRALRTEIKYQYSVDDSIYFGTSDLNIPGFGSKNYRRKNARIIMKTNPIGNKITVYFNPENPQISTLRYGPYWSNYMIIGFGSLLLILGMFIIEWKLITKIITKEK